MIVQLTVLYKGYKFEPHLCYRLRYISAHVVKENATANALGETENIRFFVRLNCARELRYAGVCTTKNMFQTQTVSLEDRGVAAAERPAKFCVVPEPFLCGCGVSVELRGSLRLYLNTLRHVMRKCWCARLAWSVHCLSCEENICRFRWRIASLIVGQKVQWWRGKWLPTCAFLWKGFCRKGH